MLTPDSDYIARAVDEIANKRKRLRNEAYDVTYASFHNRALLSERESTRSQIQANVDRAEAVLDNLCEHTRRVALYRELNHIEDDKTCLKPNHQHLSQLETFNLAVQSIRSPSRVANTGWDTQIESDFRQAYMDLADDFNELKSRYIAQQSRNQKEREWLRRNVSQYVDELGEAHKAAESKLLLQIRDLQESKRQDSDDLQVKHQEEIDMLKDQFELKMKDLQEQHGREAGRLSDERAQLESKIDYLTREKEYLSRENERLQQIQSVQERELLSRQTSQAERDKIIEAVESLKSQQNREPVVPEIPETHARFQKELQEAAVHHSALLETLQTQINDMKKDIASAKGINEAQAESIRTRHVDIVNGQKLLFEEHQKWLEQHFQGLARTTHISARPDVPPSATRTAGQRKHRSPANSASLFLSDIEPLDQGQENRSLQQIAEQLDAREDADPPAHVQRGEEGARGTNSPEKRISSRQTRNPEDQNTGKELQVEAEQPRPSQAQEQLSPHQTAHCSLEERPAQALVDRTSARNPGNAAPGKPRRISKGDSPVPKRPTRNTRKGKKGQDAEQQRKSKRLKTVPASALCCDIPELGNKAAQEEEDNTQDRDSNRSTGSPPALIAPQNTALQMWRDPETSPTQQKAGKGKTSQCKLAEADMSADNISKLELDTIGRFSNSGNANNQRKDPSSFGIVRNPAAAITNKVLQAATANRQAMASMSWGEKLASSAAERSQHRSNGFKKRGTHYGMTSRKIELPPMKELFPSGLRVPVRGKAG